ncbi:fasciclin [Maribacter algarum]|uniref:Fasciclin n=1 Tax=Maribacter algarum (ex Zhang et al. 2020) TaxID=2578118 RepID=A0A5S3QFA1_9FLAO|nr:fasciclin domain-containing protein [Maribacter algarum]TMM55947.1 fasciclin [Maribacter algarum]
MKKNVPFKSYLLLSALFLFFTSCEKNVDINDFENKTPPKNIVETAQETDALSTLVAALAKADESEGTDLIGTLSSEGPFTVFAPTNEAFSNLLSSLDNYNSLEDFSTDEDRAVLTTILSYHVVAGVSAFSTDLSNNQMISTVQGEDVTINIDADVFIQDATEVDAKVVIADVAASNGVVHVVDKVLLPQAIIDAINDAEMEALGTLVDLVVATEQLSILEAAVIKAGLAETLSSEGPFTVFAPTNDAFVELLGILGDDYHGLEDFDTPEEMDLLKDILLFHVIPNATVKAADLTEGMVPTALEGNSIDIISLDKSFVIGDATDTNAAITAVDIMASNGVAHIIDKVLLPQSAVDFVTSLRLKTIVEIAVETDDLSLLVDALVQANAGLVEALGSEGPFTVFAPTNHAFVDLLKALGDDYHSLADFDTEEEKALLVKVLTYHVVAGVAAFSTDLKDGQMIETLQGEKVGIRLNGGVHIDDATDTNASVVLADVKASNGVVHVINKVLLPQEVLDILNPPTPNIVELAQSVDDLSILVEALIQADAGLVEALSSNEFTVFAPTNEAFTNLFHALGSQYNSIADFNTHEEKALLAKILTYHVVSGATVASADLKDHQRIHTVQGESIVAFVGNSIKIKDKTFTKAKVIAADNFASNGVVHLIDKVMLPKEVLDILNH